MISTKNRLAITAAASVLAFAPLPAIAQDQPEPSGEASELTRAERLEALRDASFEPEWWSSLSNHFDPVLAGADEAAWSGDSLSGTAVLLVLFDAEDASAVRGANLATRVFSSYATHGLRVLGVYREGQEEAYQAAVTTGGLRLPAAEDQGGQLAARLAAEGSTSFYLIDHAHKLAGVSMPRRAVRTHVTRMLQERQRVQREAEREVDRTSRAPGDGASGGPGMTNPLAALAEQEPRATPEAYAAASWPRQNADLRGTAQDFQGQRLPVAPGGETWLFPSSEVSAEGRVLVLDFWAIWCGPCRAAEPRLASLQEAFPEHLMVVGMSGQSRGDRFPEDPDAIMEYLGNAYPEGVPYAHANDLDRRLYRALGVRAIPHVVVVSTDGIVRWQGNPLASEFSLAVQQTLRVDPGLRGRAD